mmetsp:Transcript_9389/g.23763  ORF Transcript_9389/g.23763 Transcript_9389/m.23763 type:complete len:103 (-) Transcript_9389:38-346(-)
MMCTGGAVGGAVSACTEDCESRHEADLTVCDRMPGLQVSGVDATRTHWSAVGGSGVLASCRRQAVSVTMALTMCSESHRHGLSGWAGQNPATVLAVSADGDG